MLSPTVRRPGRRFEAWLSAAACLALAGMPGAPLAQELEPRAYAPAPVGSNFLGLSYLHSSGGVALDPSLPAKNVEARIDSVVVAYARTFDFFGRSASIAFAQPQVWGEVEGDVGDQHRAVRRVGLADPRLRLAVNLIGGPAMDAREFAAREPETTLGASLTVAGPFGEYYSNRLINIGANRWAFKPELGLSQPLGPWTFELYAGVWLFTENEEFFRNARRKQDPVATLQTHIGYSFGPHWWLVADATYYAGGETTVNGVPKADKQENTRLGLTYSQPLGRRDSLKLTWAQGVSTRIGADFTTYAVTWQHFWFD